MNWIRIATGMKNDPSIGAIADTCRVRVAEIVGCVVSVLSELPDHARDGAVGGLSDRQIEQWAGWEGRRGVFAQAFRAHLCADGIVRSWEKHNGAAMRESDANAERAREWREQRRQARADRDANGERTRSRTESERVRERVPNGVANAKRTLLRDGTGSRTTTPPRGGVAVPAAAVRERFADPLHVAAFDRHLRAHPAPDALILELDALAAERPSDGTPGIAWPVIGQALHELSVDGKRATSGLIRAFAETVMRRERGDFARPSGAGPSGDDEAAFVARVARGDFVTPEALAREGFTADGTPLAGGVRG